MQTYKIASAKRTASIESTANLALLLMYRRWGTKWGTFPLACQSGISPLPTRRSGENRKSQRKNELPCMEISRLLVVAVINIY